MSAIGGDKLEVFPRSADRSADRSGQLIGQLIIAMMTVTTATVATVGGNTITMGGRFSHPGNDANWIGVKLRDERKSRDRDNSTVSDRRANQSESCDRKQDDCACGNSSGRQYDNGRENRN